MQLTAHDAQTPAYVIWNTALCVIVLVAGAIIFLVYHFWNRPRVLSLRTRPSTGWASILLLLWWLSLAYAYFSHQRLADGKVVHAASALLGMNLGDLCLLGAAIAYCSGDEEFRGRRFAPLPVTLALLILYYLLFGILWHGDTLSFLGSIWLFSPSVVIANVAVFAIGWAFLVRWGVTALPFLLIAVMYAVAQYPAYLHAFALKSHSLLTGSHESLASSGQVFYYLAIGKLFFVLFPAIFLFGPRDGEPPSTARAKSWPSFEVVPLPPAARKLVIAIVSTVAGAFLVALIHAAFLEPAGAFWAWLKSLFGL